MGSDVQSTPNSASDDSHACGSCGWEAEPELPAAAAAEGSGCPNQVTELALNSTKSAEEGTDGTDEAAGVVVPWGATTD